MFVVVHKWAAHHVGGNNKTRIGRFLEKPLEKWHPNPPRQQTHQELCATPLVGHTRNRSERQLKKHVLQQVVNFERNRRDGANGAIILSHSLSHRKIAGARKLASLKSNKEQAEGTYWIPIAMRLFRAWLDQLPQKGLWPNSQHLPWFSQTLSQKTSWESPMPKSWKWTGKTFEYWLLNNRRY